MHPTTRLSPIGEVHILFGANADTPTPPRLRADANTRTPRYAIVMSSLVGESLACGNLGMVATRKGDRKTAKACLDRHLKLATALKDTKAQLDASEILGAIANEGGQFAEAASYFEQSRMLAIDAGNSKSAALSKCKMGMAKGNAQYEDYIANVVAEMEAFDDGND